MKNKITVIIIAILFLNVLTLEAQDHGSPASKWSYGGGINGSLALAIIKESRNVSTPIIETTPGLNAYGLLSYKIDERYSIVTTPGIVSHLLKTGRGSRINTYFFDIPLKLQVVLSKFMSLDLGTGYMTSLKHSRLDKKGNPIKLNIFNFRKYNVSINLGLNFKLNNSFKFKIYANAMGFSIFEVKGYDTIENEFLYNVPVRSGFLGIGIYYVNDQK